MSTDTNRNENDPGLLEWYDELERRWRDLNDESYELEQMFQERERRAYEAARMRGETGGL